MKDDVYTQNDLRRYNILTMDYVLNLEPGDFLAVLDLKAEARRCLRAFFHLRRRAADHVHRPLVAALSRPLRDPLQVQSEASLRRQQPRRGVSHGSGETVMTLSYQATNPLQQIPHSGDDP